jgi:prevent-host-death family protein
MKYQEYENWTAISIANFRRQVADVIEAMEEHGVPIILTKRGVPVVQMLPVSLRAYKSMLHNMKEARLKALQDNNADVVKQLDFAIAGISGKIAHLTDDSKVLLKSQTDIRKMLADSMPLFQEYLISSEDSAMLESNTSADEAEADKQGGRKVRPAKSVIKKKATSAKSEKLPPSGGKSLKGRVKR